MNKHLVETFVAFRNSHGRSRYAEDDQEDTPGDEVLAIDQGRRGRMRNRELVLVLFSWRKVTTRFSILLSTTALAIGAVSAANLTFIFPDIFSIKCFVAMNMGELDCLFGPTRLFGELDGVFGPTRPFSELVGSLDPTRPFGELDDEAL
ncbi:hypothetical protein DY000_02047442 [Brassica cretica]|uniref:CASP-like protein n=1 Tax=Brassica cretica TaxID=69181 RepID=A0ABQ7EW34_BRACR|nr:hypothetical protein DY000_02047442 [Brassica cretica]